MSETGWVCLHRSLLTSTVWQDANAARVFVWCLLRASYTERVVRFNGQNITIRPGQFLSGRFAGAQECDMKPSTFRNALSRLVDMKILDIKSDNKKSLVTVVKWALYQDKARKEDSKKDNKRTTGGHKQQGNKGTGEQEGAAAPPHALQIFFEVTGKRPSKAVESIVMDILTGDENTADAIRPYYTEWCVRGYNAQSIVWLTEWYVTGTIPQQRGGKNESRTGTKAGVLERALGTEPELF